MITASKQLPESLPSPHILLPVGRQPLGTGIKADLTLRGARDVKERIACALAARTNTVRVDGYNYSMSKLTARCSGEWAGKRVFAKILLANPYPIPARFKAPWDAPAGGGMPVRGVGEQIDTEWNMTVRMRALSGGHSVPAPLGRSLSARTIVWDESRGISLVRPLRWSRWRGSMANAGARALFEAGTWLRNVHRKSGQGTVMVIDLPDLIRIASDTAKQQEKNAQRYDQIASRILESLLLELGESGTFTVPIALTHGDFCLSNLLWDDSGRRLTVIDFELAGFRPVCHDLFALIADLRSKLLNPLIPQSVVLSWENAFWCGYGPVSAEISSFVKALALARVFYHHLSRLLTRGERKGWIGGMNARLYRTFLERGIIAKRLSFPRTFDRRGRTK